jgi:hypothetical protein
MGLFRIRAHPDKIPRTPAHDNGIVEVTGSIPVGSTISLGA